VFELDRALISDCQRFARSFTRIPAPEVCALVEKLYTSNIDETPVDDADHKSWLLMPEPEEPNRLL
jgi:hypothetical protein